MVEFCEVRGGMIGDWGHTNWERYEQDTDLMRYANAKDEGRHEDWCDDSVVKTGQ